MKRLCLVSVFLVGCGVGESGTGHGLLEPPEEEPALGKADSWDGPSGPKVSGLNSGTEVWKVDRRWYHVTDEAGPAWPAKSGLTWDEKYAAWIESLKQINGNFYGKTFELTTPWGKQLPAPALECAETAMFLRATFASWYRLPFYMEAYSPQHGRVYYGHFGVVTRNGKRVPGAPSFARDYQDHTAAMAGKTDAEIVAAWPTDSALSKRYLTEAKDDENDFLGSEAYAGAYFDAIFLNKRVGYFLLWLLPHFGSMHLASDRNMFNLMPPALREGDVLLERWQKSGIGHTLVVKRVTPLDDQHMDAEVVYGSMPRIQPHWYNATMSKSYFTSDLTGGVGSNSDGDEYAKLGGGLKRWRTPVAKGGRWYNIVPVQNRDDYISSTDYSAIAARPAQFETLLGKMTPEEQRDAYLTQIDAARQKLMLKPASCTARRTREEVFAKLHKLCQEQFGMSKEQTDRKYRKLEDYVFAELEYNKSKTCCWNSTTAAMYEIVMQYARERVDNPVTQTCSAPVVFKAVEGKYDVFAQYAASIGRANEWVVWSADESCPQAATPDLTDSETTPAWSPFCSIADAILGGGSSGSTGGSSPYVDGQPCGSVTWEGLCEGQRAVWCENDVIQSYTCDSGTTCGYLESYGYYWCS